MNQMDLPHTLSVGTPQCTRRTIQRCVSPFRGKSFCDLRYLPQAETGGGGDRDPKMEMRTKWEPEKHMGKTAQRGRCGEGDVRERRGQLSENG